MDGEERDILRGLGLAAIALASATLTATLVIGVGSILMHAGQAGDSPPHVTSTFVVDHG